MLNKDFMPAYVWVKEFMKEADEPFTIAVERENGIVENYETKINKNDTEKSKFYIERTVKTLLWFYGGFKIYLSGQNEICEYIKQCYSKGGIREFDMDFMADVYSEKFEVVICDKVPNTTEEKSRICIENDGNVVGLDVGASFIKVCAMSDGENVYSDFEYLNIAIKNSVTEYLLKPTDIDELEERFRNLKKRVDSERERGDKLKKRKTYYLDNILKLMLHGYMCLQLW